MKYAVNEQGVSALNTMSAAISEAAEKILGLTKALDTCASDHQNTLGPHKASIDEVIEEINGIIESATEPVDNISEVLKDIADSYQDIIDNDGIKGSAGKR